MMQVRPFVIGVVLLFSGCVSGGSASDAPVASGPAEYSDVTGGIEGILTDEEIQPLVGAIVGLLERPDSQVVTDDAGRFSFSNLDPGTYTVAATMLGYESGSIRVEVVAGDSTDVQLMLGVLPVEGPYTTLIIHRGKIEHGLGLVRTATCSNCGTDATRYEFKEGPPEDWKAFTIEVEWQTADYLGIDFLDRSDDETGDRNKTGVYWRVRAQSPVHGFVERCGDYRDEVYFGGQPVPCDDEENEGRNYLIENWYVGGYQQETHTLDPVCQTPPLNYRQGCYGLGYIPELVYTDYITIWHYEVPPDAALYSAVPDS